MTSKDTLGDRMKRYEAVTDISMINKMPVIVRVDGRAFHTITRGMKKPFDDGFMSIMDNVMLDMCKKMQNVLFAYCQSDEISLVMYEKNYETDSMFDNRVQKIVSTASAIASIAFRNYIDTYVTDTIEADIAKKMVWATFDARAFNIPRQDVANYFLWRQNDCYKNAVNTIALTEFSTKELNKKNQKDRIDMLKEKGIDIDTIGRKYMLGRMCVKGEDGWYIPVTERFTEAFLEPVMYKGMNWYEVKE